VASQAGRRFGTPVQLLVLGSVPAVLVASGTVGYHALEGWSWFDALYTSVITLTSMGHDGALALSTAGRAFTMVLAVGGIFTIAAVAAEILGIIITGELHELWERWRMSRRIGALEHHVIVCGHGRVGQQVCAELRDGGVPFVVVDRREAALAQARDLGLLAVLGDATVEETLRGAGIGRARALVATAGANPDNILITMTARALSPTLPIAACAEDEVAIPKLLRAGATRIVSLGAVVGGRLVQAVLRPTVLDPLDVATADLQMQERRVDPGSPLDGKKLGSSGLRSRPGLMVVAIRHPDGRLAFDPDDDAPVAAGDTLITLTVAR
jgi:voltage-gated potassium channel